MKISHVVGFIFFRDSIRYFLSTISKLKMCFFPSSLKHIVLSHLSEFCRPSRELTERRVELLLRQVLIIVDVVVLQQVEQRALREVLGQTLLFDHLRTQ